MDKSLTLPYRTELSLASGTDRTQRGPKDQATFENFLSHTARTMNGGLKRERTTGAQSDPVPFKRARLNITASALEYKADQRGNIRLNKFIPRPNEADLGQHPQYLKEMNEDYKGEERGECKKFPTAVEYLDEVGRKPYKVKIKDGLVVNSKEEPIDTTHMNTAFQKVPKMGIFVMDPQGDIYVRQKVVGKFHHSSFLAGQPVAAAGFMRIEKGKIKAIWDSSGHYAPEYSTHTVQLLKRLKKQGVEPKHIDIQRAK